VKRVIFIVNLFYMYILYKCYLNKTVIFIVFPVTVLLQGQFKVETKTSLQPHFNVVSTVVKLDLQHRMEFHIT